jgi:hypothetical protein
MGYHKRAIVVQGTYGEVSKIEEELDELKESFEQDNKILALCELSDLYGAMEAVAEKLGVNMEDIKKMSAATKRAFQSGARR